MLLLSRKHQISRYYIRVREAKTAGTTDHTQDTRLLGEGPAQAVGSWESSSVVAEARKDDIVGEVGGNQKEGRAQGGLKERNISRTVGQSSVDEAPPEPAEKMPTKTGCDHYRPTVFHQPHA